MPSKPIKNLDEALRNASEVRALQLKLQKNEGIPNDIYKLTNLEDLILHSETLDILDIGTLLRLKTLTISAPTLRQLSPRLFELPALQSLTVKGGKIETLPEITRPNVTLRTLSLANNIIHEIGPSLGRLRHLDTLFLNGNAITKMSNELVAMKGLTRLMLDHNQLSRLPDFILALPKLRHLSIDGNPFPEEEKERIMKLLPIWF